jgi:hypothetical protein
MNLAKNMHRGAKVTLLALSAVITIGVTATADDSQTLLTLKGKRYEKVHVTEITPVTIAFKHSTGVARLSFTEFGPDVQKKYGYDETKARAWVMQIAEQEQQQADAAAKARYDAFRNQEKIKAEMERMKSMLNAVYDPMSHRWYRSADEAAAAREQALKDALELRFLHGN